MRAARLASLLLLVGACAKRQPDTAFVSWVFVEGPDPRGEGLRYDPDLPPLVDGARDVGARRRTAWEARQVVQTRRTEWWQIMQLPLSPRELPQLDWALAREDAARVQRWFVDQGFVEATVGLRTHVAHLWFNHEDDDRFWRLSFVVDAGPRERAAEVALAGDEALPLRLRGTLRRLLPPAGQWTSPARRGAAAREMERVLSEEGFPFAEVEDEVTGPVEARQVRFTVRPGGAPIVADVDAGTGPPLSDPLVRHVADRALPVGEPWSGRRARYLREQLEARTEVQEVDLVVRPLGPAGATVDVLVVPEERRSVKGSFHAGVSGSLLNGGARVDWAVRALGGAFATVNGFSTVEYRLFDGPPGAFLSELQHGPSSLHRLELEGLFAPLRGLGGYAAAGGGLDTWRGYVQARGYGETGLRWRPSPTAALGLFFRGGYERNFPWPWQQDAFAEAFGPEPGPTGERMARAYDQVAVGLRLDVDRREFGEASERGTALSIEALPWGRSLGVPWSRFSLDFTWHAPALPGRLTLITGLRAGVHVMDDTEVGSVIGNRFFLGGPGDYRGSGFRRMGPVGAQASLADVHIGGDVLLHASLDARIRLHPSFDVTPFIEVGRVWASLLDVTTGAGGTLQRGVNLADLQPVAGLGAALHTAGQRVEGWAGVRLIRDAGLADALPQLVLQVRLQREVERPRLPTRLGVEQLRGERE